VSDVLSSYYDFLRAKRRAAKVRGLSAVPELHPDMFGYQRDVTEFLLEVGCGAAFGDTGLGKSFISLEWGRVISEHTNRPVLMLAPLAVGPQHEREAQRFGLPARYVRTPDAISGPGVWITNYERLHLFDASPFAGLILDESSIVKSFTGKTSRALIEFATHVPYVLAATATPAPNDHMELGQHSALLKVMPSNEMLARWFTADQSEMGKYRLKRYGVEDFWAWVASWARMFGSPSDLGHSDEDFALPELRVDLHFVDSDITSGRGDGELFRVVDTSATRIHSEKRRTAPARALRIAELVALEPSESWCIWCDTDYEADALMAMIPEAVEVRGSHPADLKERRLIDFSEGRERVIVTKPSIAGFGLNWQHCARVAFVGVSFSYESYYQAIRRFWRFGQLRPVHVHVAMADTEAVIWNTIQRKAADHAEMKRAMHAAMKEATQEYGVKLHYQPRQPARIPQWVKA